MTFASNGSGALTAVAALATALIKPFGKVSVRVYTGPHSDRSGGPSGWVSYVPWAFLGVTVGCAKCHNHMTDPISQKEYYQVRAIFEPHQVRTDKIPGSCA